ncbi:MAG: putative Ig domain-containing protein, partial [Planctomycetaceae bacterium]
MTQPIARTSSMREITASNSPSSFSATGLPAGLSVNSSTGLIGGSPAAAGTSNVTILATNEAGSGNATLVLTIAPAPVSAPQITSNLAANGKVGDAFSYQIAASNSPASFAA